jgi:hypothetical protein
MTAAASTINALMYGLRGGVDVLARPDMQRRLSELDDKQLLDVATQLQHRKVAPSWTKEQIEILVTVWRKIL